MGHVPAGEKPRHDVPVGNVLDLRNIDPATKPRRPAGRPDPLKEFWQKPESRVAPAKRSMPFRISKPQFRFRPGRIHLGFFGARLGWFPAMAGVALLSFAGVSVFAQVSGLRQDVFRFGRAGLQAVEIAKARAANRDLAGAAQAFSQAEEHFAAAESSFGTLHPALTGILNAIPVAGSSFRSGQHLVAAARALTEAASSFSAVAEPLSADGQGLRSVADLVENLDRDQVRLEAIVDRLRFALNELDQVRADRIPDGYRQPVETLQRLTPTLRVAVNALADGTDVAANLLGVGQPTELLFAFQNSNELRPTGGFLGSFALLRLDRGELRILDAPPTGSYGVDSYLPSTIRPPLPLQVITPSWYFHDANWYPDFPTSAEQIVRFYELARGFRPNGVVALTNRLLENLLAVTGPIELGQYDVTVDTENVTSVTQEQTERKYDLRANDPKQFIADLLPQVAERVADLPADRYPALLAVLASAFTTGDLQVWSPEQSIQTEVVRLGWGGSFPSSLGDTFALVDANVGGGKTDRVITTDIVDRVVVQTDGTAVATVTVRRRHEGQAGDALTGARNRTYHRLYVPLGSKLLSAEGFAAIPPGDFQPIPDDSAPDPLLARIEGRVVVDELSGTRMNDEFGRTVFGNWTELHPGEETSFVVTYQLPFRLTSDLERYDFSFVRQAGSQRRTFTFELEVPTGRDVTWTSDQAAIVERNLVRWTLDRTSMNRSFSAILER